MAMELLSTDLAGMMKARGGVVSVSTAASAGAPTQPLRTGYVKGGGSSCSHAYSYFEVQVCKCKCLKFMLEIGEEK